MSRILICPTCQAEHKLRLRKTGWFVCPQCRDLLRVEGKNWDSHGPEPKIQLGSNRYYIGQEGLIRQRPFTIVGCIQFSLIEDPDDIWFEWILAFVDGGFVLLVEVEGDPPRFFAQRRPISHTVPDFSEAVIGKSIQIENFFIDVFERHSSLVMGFCGEIPPHQAPGSIFSYIDGYYNQYVVAVTYEEVPMICFGTDLAESELILHD